MSLFTLRVNRTLSSSVPKTGHSPSCGKSLYLAGGMTPTTTIFLKEDILLNMTAKYLCTSSLTISSSSRPVSFCRFM